MMRVGILADSHDRLPDALIERFAEVDEVWHLGDVCSPVLLAEFEDKPVSVVRGNCDTFVQWPVYLNLKREELSFYLVHLPPPQPPPDVNIVVHGHTHEPRDEMVKGVRYLNPGSVSRPRNSPPSFGVLEFEKNEILSWKIVTL